MAKKNDRSEQEELERQEKAEEQLEAQSEERKDLETLRAEDAAKAAAGEDPYEGEAVHEFSGEPLKDVKAGDLVAPASNPGAVARVPDRPLQPESLQSHGMGIYSDKDLVNTTVVSGDQEAVGGTESVDQPEPPAEEKGKKGKGKGEEK